MRTTVTPRTMLALLLAVGSVAGTAAADAEAASTRPLAKSSSQATAAPTVSPDAVKAMASETHLSLAEVKRRLAQEKTLDARGDRIEAALGDRSGGSFLDADGKLVVTTLDAAASAQVARNDARAKQVDDSAAELDAIKAKLDRHAETVGAGAVQGWYVDVPSNTVVVTVTAGAIDARTIAMKRLAMSFGDSVRIEHKPAAEAPKATAEWMVGGFEYKTPTGGSCSVGFNTLDSANRNVVLTAGHCVATAGTTSRSGLTIGATRSANFPVDDFGTFWNSYPGYWQPSRSVYKYNSTYAHLVGLWTNPPVGATVCKSGKTTGFTCGRITAFNQAVNYGGKVVSGLVRHDACVEPGDSGGSNISAGNYALGVTSGASLVDTRWCLGRYGQANVSYYQPVGEALTANGLRLVL